MKIIPLILIGFGNVGQAFAQLLEEKRLEIEKMYNFQIRIYGIATQSHGCAYDSDGIDLHRAIECKKENASLAALSKRPSLSGAMELIQCAEAEVMCENTSVNYADGQPAVNHCLAALERSMHVITANKGPVVHAYDELQKLAKEKNKHFFFESAVMDGAPVFTLFRKALPLVQVHGFEGILNSCINLMLELMQGGMNLEQAIAFAQSIGIAETDPSGDVDGWDAAIKVAALATVVMGQQTKPKDVEREGIRSIGHEELRAASEQGKRWKLVCRAESDGEKFKASVKLQMVAADSPLYSVNGTSSYIQFHTDMLPGLGILESNPSPKTTAYGLLSDLLDIYTG